MPTIRKLVNGIECISTDYHNFRNAAKKADDIYELALISRVESHPCLPFISVHFLFSYYKKYFIAEGYTRGSAEIRAMDEIIKCLKMF